MMATGISRDQRLVPTPAPPPATVVISLRSLQCREALAAQPRAPHAGTGTMRRSNGRHDPPPEEGSEDEHRLRLRARNSCVYFTRPADPRSGVFVHPVAPAMANRPNRLMT